MPSSRIVYRNWIADLGHDPSVSVQSESDRQDNISGEVTESSRSDRVERIRANVRAALAELSEDERELIEQVHFMGRGCAEIAVLTGRAEYRLEALHNRVLRKLRRRLAPLVKELYGVDSPAVFECPICRSSRREEIDRLIRDRDRCLTWRPVMKQIATEFGVRITTPQTLIGHEKYH